MALRDSETDLRQFDDKALDIRLISSCIDFVNEDLEEDMPLDQRFRHFDWVTTAIAARAKAAGLALKPLGKLKSPGSSRDLQMLAARFKVGFSQLQQMTTMDDFDQRNFENWINKVLGDVVIHQVVRAQNATAHRISIPRLTTVEQCLAYSLASLLEDRWGLLERIRVCPFHHGKTQLHWFLDYRIDESGRLRKAQQFCCPEHANRYRQHHYRQRQKTARKPR